MTRLQLLRTHVCTVWVAGLAMLCLAPVQAEQVTWANADAQSTRIEPDFRPSFEHCWDRARQNLPAKRRCIRDEMVYQDRQLNSNYTKLMRVLSVTERELLRQDKRQWIAERAQACTPERDKGDTQGLLDSKYCELHRTALQAKELKTRYELEK